MKAEIFTVLSVIFVWLKPIKFVKVYMTNILLWWFMREVGKIQCLPLLFSMWLVRQVLPRCTKDNTLGSVRGGDNISNMCFDGATAHCLCNYLLSPFVVIAQSWFAANLPTLSFPSDSFNFISSASKEKALITVWILEKKAAASVSPLPH